MSNPTQTTQTTTKNGIEDKSKKDVFRQKQLKTHLIDGGSSEEMSTQSETIIDFMNRVELTRGHDDIIETSPEIIKHFNPKGLGEATHFTYKGLIVCEFGKRAAVEAAMNMTLEEKLHPRT